MQKVHLCIELCIRCRQYRKLCERTTELYSRKVWNSHLKFHAKSRKWLKPQKVWPRQSCWLETWSFSKYIHVFCLCLCKYFDFLMFKNIFWVLILWYFWYLMLQCFIPCWYNKYGLQTRLYGLERTFYCNCTLFMLGNVALWHVGIEYRK